MKRASLPLLWLGLTAFSYAQVSVDPVHDNGPSDNRVDMTFMGDGWVESEDAEMTGILHEHIDFMFNTIPVYERYAGFFNIYLLHHHRSGPSGDWQTEANISYYLDVINQAVPAAEVRYMVSHSGGYGEGGNVGMADAALSMTSDRQTDVGLHEMGHGWHRLGDIYGRMGADYWPNCTSDPNSGKWDRWVGYVEPFNHLEAGYWPIQNSDYYRSLNTSCCMMADVWCGDPLTYDVVSREKVVLDIYQKVDPLDDWTSNSSTLDNPSAIEVNTVDSNVIKVDWYVDNELAAEDGGESFDVYQHISMDGQYTVKAHAYDYVIKAAFSDRGGDINGEAGSYNPDSLDWVRKDLDQLQQEVEWQVNIADITGTGKAAFTAIKTVKITSKAMELYFSDKGAYQVDLLTPSGRMVERITSGYAHEPVVRITWEGRAYDTQVYLIRITQGSHAVWSKWIH
jgi:hypothetical protein